MKEISLKRFISHFCDNKRIDKRFCFILGAGASKSSGIPTGAELVDKWIKELREFDEEDLNKWLLGNKIDEGNFAANYSKIFDKRFELRKKDGYDLLEKLMEGKEPSYGYSALAQILAQGNHNVVITTNFDSLIEDALFIYTQKKPLVIGHSALANYIKANLTRPIIIKIHHDLFLSPKNSEQDICEIDLNFRKNMEGIFKYYTPLVLGYGGNDGSLMGFLESMKEIEGGIFWFYHEPSGKPIKQIYELIEKYNGFLIPIKGYDEFMIQLANKLELGKLDEKISEIANERVKKYREQIDKLTAESSDDADTKTALTEIVARGEKNWWSYDLKAREEKNNEKRNEIYLEGISQFPKSHELIVNYANFLSAIKKDYKLAEAYYCKALELEPNNNIIIGNYAVFISNIRKDYDKAEEYLKKAIELDPNNVVNIGNFAFFLSDIRKDYDGAEEYYKKVFELDPINIVYIRNYAIFLRDIRKDYDKSEEYFKKAIELDPNNSESFVNYAIFLSNIRKDYNRAEKYYCKALELNPRNSVNTESYAIFLSNVRKDYERSEEYFKKAIELDMNDAVNIGNYAIFLNNIRKNYDLAEEYYKKAIELDPNNLTYIESYAIFLNNIRKNYDLAEEYYKKAIELDPNNAANIGNYALFLKNIKKSFDIAEDYYRKAVKLAPESSAINESYAIFLSDIRKDYDRSEEYFKKAIELDPNNSGSILHYAIFLSGTRKAFDLAEEYYKKAIELDPSFSKTVSYAIFLSDIRKDYNCAEEYYKKAIELDLNNANLIGNYAKLLIVKEEFEKAKENILKAFELNKAEKYLILELELWFYCYAVFYDCYPESKEKIEELLNAGVQSFNFDLKCVLEVAKKKGHPDYQKLCEFEKRITTPAE